MVIFWNDYYVILNAKELFLIHLLNSFSFLIETFVLILPRPRTSWEKQGEVNEGIQIFLRGN